ncbi:glycosyltransferase family 2 protein [Mariniflexile gromovii]|uniref:Glycosyltransferase n=1 Tax=Mariniflexile gromovii TaxID=362523 RepID=A0ABS4BST6_9FLAO|nr:glycosyltransferase [Mariniflexile gromovii]MBP0903650.1 glycosyltransferase [Mariniflexile gromovii]
MLSILIPTYNYDITSLLLEIHKQVTGTNIKFEIICLDDKSEIHVVENKKTVDTLLHTKIIISDENLGRIKARQVLSDEAIYEWLLFLDADVMPKSEKFIEKYVKTLDSNYEAIFGGFAYSSTKPDNKSVLRWKYGKTFEEVDAKKRNTKPHQLIISANFLIKKPIFNKINRKIDRKSYGLDNYFAALLKQQNVNVLHLNNEVYHYGLESSATYLNKLEEAIVTLLWMYNKERIFDHHNKLLTMFVFFKKFKLNYPMALFHRIFNLIMKKNLVSNHPNMFLLQVYKLSYICHKDLHP